MEIAVELSKTIISELNEQQFVFLKEIDGERSFPITIGITEALAIDRRLKDIPTPRPMTHDLMEDIIESMGGNLIKIVIDDYSDHIFYATLYIETNTGFITVDSRPSDALALGISLGTPIYIEDHIFEMILDKSDSTKEERLDLLRERLSALTEQISTIESMMTDTLLTDSLIDSNIPIYKEHLAEMKSEQKLIIDLLNKYSKG